jgi:hypothetical protein
LICRLELLMQTLNGVGGARFDWLGSRRLKAKRLSPASCGLSITARCVSRRLRMKALHGDGGSAMSPRRGPVTLTFAPAIETIPVV